MRVTDPAGKHLNPMGEPQAWLSEIGTTLLQRTLVAISALQEEPREVAKWKVLLSTKEEVPLLALRRMDGAK